MTLFINGHFLQQKITGVQRCAIELIKELDELCSSNDCIEILCSNEPIINEINLKNIKIRKVGFLKKNLWGQITFPLYSLIKHADTLGIANIESMFYPSFVFVHDQTDRNFPQSYSKKHLFVWHFIRFFSLKKAKKIFTVSNFSKSEILKFYPQLKQDKIIVVYNSANHLKKITSDNNIDNETIRTFLSENKEFYLTVGSKIFHKNQKFIYKLATLHPEKNFIIVGGKSNSMRDMEDTDMMCPNIFYTGYISDKELNNLYLHAKGFIFPSLYEGFGIPVLEAICLGTKTVAVSDILVFNELFSKNVYKFDPYKAENFSFEKMNKSIISEDVRNWYCEKFSWKSSAKIIYDTIKKFGISDKTKKIKGKEL